MDIQFDPFSFAVAGIAVLIAWRAHYLAKTAPARQRVQANRDAVRDALVVAVEAIESARSKLVAGQDLPAVPDAVRHALNTLNREGARVPDGDALSELGHLPWSADHYWKQTLQDEARAAANREKVQGHREELDSLPEDDRSRPTIQRRIQSSQRTLEMDMQGRESSRIQFATQAESASRAIERYVSELDAHDRHALDKRRFAA